MLKDWVTGTCCRYAWECQTQEGGWGLDNVLRENNWKLRGIVNGMDYTEWNPASDKFLNSDGYRHYNTDNFEVGKAACKAALQRVSPVSLVLKNPQFKQHCSRTPSVGLLSIKWFCLSNRPRHWRQPVQF